MSELGLLVLHAGGGGEASIKPTVDIVAVHGINGHRIDSWKHRDIETSEETMWLSDLLPNRIPHARVMTFGYDPIRDGDGMLSSSGLRQTALELLNALPSERKHGPPIIFICHSLGGVIVKHLLWIVNNDSNFFHFAPRTVGMVCFGSPHQVKESSSWANVIFDIALASTEGTSSQRRRDIMTSIIQTSTETLEETTRQFHDLIMQYHILNIYETKPTPFIEAMIVPKSSATFELIDGTSVGCEENHMRICRLSKQNGKLLDILCEFITETMTASPNIETGYLECRHSFSIMCPSTSFRVSVTKTPSSLDWLVLSETFLEWRHSKSPAILHIYGQSGSGKTVLSMLLLGFLQKSKADEFLTLLFQFNQSDDRRQSARDFFLSLIRQMLFQRQSIYKNAYVQRLYQNMKNGLTWTNEYLWALFRAMLLAAQSETSTICIIDAIEECDSSKDDLLHKIDMLRNRTESPLKFVVLSKPDPNLASMLKPSHSIDIDNEPGVKTERGNFTRIRIMKFKHLSHDLISKIHECNATFLQLNLLFSIFESSSTLSNLSILKQTLEDLPKQLDLSTLYGTTMTAINDESPQERQWSLKAMSWLVFSPRPMKVDELIVAVAVDCGAKSFLEIQANTAQSTEALKRRLGMFVKIEDNEVHLVHHTVKEFLTQCGNQYGIDFDSAGKWYGRLVHVCLTYLCLDELKCDGSFVDCNGTNPQLRVPKSPPNCYALLSYAAAYWPVCCRLAFENGAFIQNSELLDDVKSFLVTHQGGSWWTEVYDFLRDPSSRTHSATRSVKSSPNSTPQISQDVPREHGLWWDNPLYTAAHLGLVLVVETLLANDAYSWDQQVTALDIAAGAGHALTVKALTKSEWSTPWKGWASTMGMACTNGHEAVVREIINHLSGNPEEPGLGKLDLEKSELEVLKPRKSDPGRLNLEMLEKSLCQDPPGKERGDEDKKEETRTEKAKSEEGEKKEAENEEAENEETKDEEIKDEEAKDKEKRHEEKAEFSRYLCIAAEMGHTNIVHTLIEAAANIEAVGEKGATPLILAAKNGFDSVVDELVKADPTAVDDQGWTALHYAAQNGHVAVVQSLLTMAGIDVDTSYNGITPLYLATENGEVEVLKELLKYKANIEITPEGENLLNLAISKHHSSVVKVLLDAGAVFSEQLEGLMPLHFACMSDENLDIIEILLSAGADPDTLGVEKFRPLHMAADWSQPGVARKLLEAGANEDPVGGDYRWTPLLLAAYHGNLDIVRILLEHGADIKRRLRAEYEGCTALHLGTSNSEIVGLLLAHGADISTRDAFERTPLFYAAGRGNVESTNELLKRGLKENLEDKFGRVALDVTVNRTVWNALSLEGETEPYPEDITCGMINITTGNDFRFVYDCDVCDQRMGNGFFYHCCECELGGERYFDICMTCYPTGKQCPGNHKLRARFWGDHMVSYEEFRPWVATLKTPAQLRELSAIGADGMSGTASEQLEKE